MSADETVYYNEENITVTNARLVIEGQTLAMSGIIAVQSLRESSRFLAVIFGIMGAAIGQSVNVWAGLAMVFIAVIWYQLGVKYTIVLSTSSGEMSALQGRSENKIGRIVQALNNAIVATG